MSLPTQLSKPFLPSDLGMDDDKPAGDDFSALYDDLDFGADMDFYYDGQLLEAPAQRFGHLKHFSVDGRRDERLLPPFSLNSGLRFNFSHLRNVSLDGMQLRPGAPHAAPHPPADQPPHCAPQLSPYAPSPYAPSPHPLRRVSHRPSALLLADPPLGLFPHSHLGSTLHLADLVPPLLLLVSNPLLLDLPYSLAHTPARRKKSASVSSLSHTTPLRAPHWAPPTSPAQHYAKVGKTPLKTHRRTRLKAEPASLLSAMAAKANPFDAHFHLPTRGFDYDEPTPLTTPARALASPPLYFTPAARFGGALAALDVEDQDDDACKQLRKARTIASSDLLARAAPDMLVRASSARNLRLDHLPDRTLRTSALKSYPASIDLASITNSAGPLPLPDVLAPRAARPLLSPGRPPLLHPYPSSLQIHQTAATEEIARFAESILNSDTKRPIVVQLETEDDPRKKHLCPLCLARFQRPEHVKRHLKSHSTEKPFMCDMPNCGRRFNRKDNLKAHLKKIHSTNS